MLAYVNIQPTLYFLMLPGRAALHRSDLFNCLNQSSAIASLPFGLMCRKEWDLQPSEPQQIPAMQLGHSGQHVLATDLHVPKAYAYCSSTYRLAVRQQDWPRVHRSSKPITLFGMVFQKQTWCWPLRAPSRQKNYCSEATEVLDRQLGVAKVLPLVHREELQRQLSSAPAHLVHASPEQ